MEKKSIGNMNTANVKSLLRTIRKELSYDFKTIAPHEITAFQYLKQFFRNMLFSSSFHLNFTYRVSHYIYKKYKQTTLTWFLAEFISQVGRIITGSEISYKSEIGEGSRFLHAMGIVIGSDVKIGDKAKILNDVTLGSSWTDNDDTALRQPCVGDRVIIGTGAKLIGGITIGDDVIIAANAVVTESFPSGLVIGGVPAKILKENTAAG